MAIAQLNKIDDKLTEIYENKVTTVAPVNYEDKSEMLFDYMQMIASNNKMFLKLT